MRKVAELFSGRSGTDGAGVNLFQVNVADKSLIDPFVHLDEIAIENHHGSMPGFPTHPHRGSQFLTYLKHGELYHKDSLGGSGKLESGDIQYLNAGNGVLHSEMPQVLDGKLNIFQIWINLAIKDKAAKPSYQDVKSAELSKLQIDGAKLILLAGEVNHESWQDNALVREPITGFSVVDCCFDNENTVKLNFASELKVLVYVYSGKVNIAAQKVHAQQLAVLTAGEFLALEGEPGSKCLILSGNPLNEPVVCGGPFVMADEQGLLQAYQDLQAGKYGQIS
jgi:redox-sensitive bicupin YhaK (pirin superfamily)